jgi:aspartate racemase
VYGIESPLEEEFRRWHEHQQLEITVEELAARNVGIMRGVQPRGPYYLAGFGFGGVLAFEAASQLQRQGERVELLALLDTAYRPGLTPRALPWLRRWSHHARLAATHAPTYVVEKFRKRPDAGKRPRPDLQLVPARHRDPDEVQENPRRPRGQFHDQMLSAYRGKPYSGGAVLFRTIQEPVSSEFDLGTTNGWAELMLGGLQVEELECGHLDITEEPYVGEVAKRLASHLLRKSCGSQIYHPSPPGQAANAS